MPAPVRPATGWTCLRRRLPVPSESESSAPPSVASVARRRTTKDLNHSVRSRKSHWDCTICHSCRWAGRDWILQQQRENQSQSAGLPSIVECLVGDRIASRRPRSMFSGRLVRWTGSPRSRRFEQDPGAYHVSASMTPIQTTSSSPSCSTASSGTGDIRGCSPSLFTTSGILHVNLSRSDLVRAPKHPESAALGGCPTALRRCPQPGPDPRRITRRPGLQRQGKPVTRKRERTWLDQRGDRRYRGSRQEPRHAASGSELTAGLTWGNQRRDLPVVGF